jgi:hypothetical protein
LAFDLAGADNMQTRTVHEIGCLTVRSKLFFKINTCTNIRRGHIVTMTISNSILLSSRKSLFNGTIISAVDSDNNINDLYNSIVSAEIFLGFINNYKDIINANSGYARFEADTKGKPDIFQIIPDGNFGVLIKKTGKIFINYNQYIKTNKYSENKYVHLAIKLNSVILERSIISGTDGKWSEIQINGSYDVKQNQVLTFEFFVFGNTGDSIRDLKITGIDGLGNNERASGHLSIVWIG